MGSTYGSCSDVVILPQEHDAILPLNQYSLKSPFAVAYAQFHSLSLKVVVVNWEGLRMPPRDQLD